MNRRVLVIGAGRVGVGKARILIQSGALVTMIASEVRAPLPDGLVACHLRDYRVGDLRGHHLVVSATGDVVTNERIVAEARYAGVWLNVVDDPERSDFYFTAVHRDGDVVVSVSTQGASPALAQELRSRIRDALPPNLAVVADNYATNANSSTPAGSAPSASIGAIGSPSSWGRAADQ